MNWGNRVSVAVCRSDGNGRGTVLTERISSFGTGYLLHLGPEASTPRRLTRWYSGPNTGRDPESTGYSPNWICWGFEKVVLQEDRPLDYPSKCHSMGSRYFDFIKERFESREDCPSSLRRSS